MNCWVDNLVRDRNEGIWIFLPSLPAPGGFNRKCFCRLDGWMDGWATEQPDRQTIGEAAGQEEEVEFFGMEMSFGRLRAFCGACLPTFGVCRRSRSVSGPIAGFIYNNCPVVVLVLPERRVKEAEAE